MIRSSLARRIAPETLHGRLAALLGALVVVGAAGLYVFVPSILGRYARLALEEKAEAIATMTAHTVVDALVLEDRDQLLRKLDDAADVSGVRDVRLVTSDGVQLRSEAPERATDGGVLNVVVPVMAGTDTLARIYTSVSTASVLDDVRLVRRSMALFSVIILVTGLVVTWLLTYRLVHPLSSMVGVAERIAAGDVGVRAEKSSHPEANRLAEAFNRMVERLQASQQRLEDILEGLPAPVGLFDKDLDCVYHNRAAMGWPAREVPAELDPSTFWDQLPAPPETVSQMKEGLRRSLESGVPAYMEQTMPGPPERTYLFFANPFGQGDQTGVIGFGANITDLKAAQKALARSEERLLQAQKMEAVGRLAGGVAHDFNNLLTVIGGNVDLMRLDGDADPVLDEIAEATNRAAALTNQLLAFSRKQVVQLERLDPDEVLTGVKKLLGRLIGEDVELVTDFGVAGRRHVSMDRGQFGQIAMNLAVNARDAMPHGGRLLIQTRLCPDGPPADAPGIHEHDEWVVLEIADTGHGMDDETRSRIFEPFYTTKSNGEGTGLGLATVYAIVTEASGAVDVESEPGCGTTFRIWLPAYPVTAPEKARDEEEEVTGTETILVVEDEEPVRTLVQRLLEQSGYTVVAVKDPVAALAYFTPGLKPPDLLLTDVVLPGMNGRQLADQLRRTVGNLRVLFMSGYTDDAVVVRGVLSERMAFVQKPFSRAELTRAVRQALDAPLPSGGQRGGTLASVGDPPDRASVARP